VSQVQVGLQVSLEVCNNNVGAEIGCSDRDPWRFMVHTPIIEQVPLSKPKVPRVFCSTEQQQSGSTCHTLRIESNHNRPDSDQKYRSSRVKASPKVDFIVCMHRFTRRFKNRLYQSLSPAKVTGHASCAWLHAPYRNPYHHCTGTVTVPQIRKDLQGRAYTHNSIAASPSGFAFLICLNNLPASLRPSWSCLFLLLLFSSPFVLRCYQGLNLRTTSHSRSCSIPVYL